VKPNGVIRYWERGFSVQSIDAPRREGKGLKPFQMYLGGRKEEKKSRLSGQKSRVLLMVLKGRGNQLEGGFPSRMIDKRGGEGR